MTSNHYFNYISSESKYIRIIVKFVSLPILMQIFVAKIRKQK